MHTDSREITLEDIQHFADFTGDQFYAHTDEEAAAKNPFFDGRVAHGYLIVSFAAGLFVDPDFGPVLANYGVDDLRFLTPLYYGDSMRVRLACKQKTLRGDSGYGEVRWDAEVTNQDGEIVAQYDVLTMVATDEHWASVVGPTLFGGCSENCCNVPFGVKRVNKDGSVSVDVGNIATITKLKPKSLTGAIREMLTDSDMFQFEIHDPSVTPQQRASLLGVLLLADYMFFERNLDQCGYNDGFFINLCNCYFCGALFPCQLKLPKNGG